MHDLWLIATVDHRSRLLSARDLERTRIVVEGLRAAQAAAKSAAPTLPTRFRPVAFHDQATALERPDAA